MRSLIIDILTLAPAGDSLSIAEAASCLVFGLVIGWMLGEIL